MATLNVDKLFVSKLIQDGDSAPIKEVEPYFLFDPEYRKAYEYIRTYFAEHGTLPSLRVMQSDIPNAPIVKVTEPWEDIIKRIQEKYVHGIMTENLDLIEAHRLEGNTKEAINLLGVLASKVHTAIPNKRDVDVTKTGEERLARYLERRDNPGTLVGIPTGFPTIDRATQGLQKGQLITVTGLPKASKSVIAMLFAMAAQEAGMKVLYLTYEMTCDEQTNRLDAYRAGFNDNKLNSGDISTEDLKKLKEGLDYTASLPPIIIAEDVMTISAIGAQCDIHDPDIVIIDGMYMMEDEQGEAMGTPMALAHIVAGSKFLAMRRKICIVGITQSTPARTKGETLNNDSIMGSRAFIQYSNTVIGVERVPDDKLMRKLKIIMSRSCAPCEVMLQFDFDTAMFMEDPDYLAEAGDEDLEDMFRGENGEEQY